MALYLVRGSIAFSSTTNATNAYNAMSAQVGNFPDAVPSTRTIHPSGIVRSSSTVTWAYEIPEESRDAFTSALRAGWSPYTRSNIIASAVRIGGT